MANFHAALPDTFHALADPTRLAVVERLCRGAAPAGELAEPFAMALPSFLKHLRVLEEARLISTRKVGRVRMVRIEPRRLAAAANWFGDRRALWQRRLDRLDDFLAKQGKKKP